MTLYLLVPLMAAVAFAVGSLVYKRAFAEGAGIAHAVILNNAALAVAFLPLFWVDPRPVPWGLVHLPAITATTFVLGHLLNVLSLRLGDVSVATPLLGAKVVMVALLGRVVFDWPVAPAQFVAAALATGGVLVMGAADWHGGRRTGLTILLALGCALCFAFTDVLIQLLGRRRLGRSTSCRCCLWRWPPSPWCSCLFWGAPPSGHPRRHGSGSAWRPVARHCRPSW